MYKNCIDAEVFVIHGSRFTLGNPDYDPNHKPLDGYIIKAPWYYTFGLTTVLLALPGERQIQSRVAQV